MKPGTSKKPNNDSIENIMKLSLWKDGFWNFSQMFVGTNNYWHEDISAELEKFYEKKVQKTWNQIEEWFTYYNNHFKEDVTTVK